MTRRTILLLFAMIATLLLASGVALAVNKVGTNGPDTLRGTNRDDNLLGKGGQDDLFGLGGRDNLLGGSGKDNVIGGSERRIGGGDKNLAGGPGNDFVVAGQGSDNALGEGGNDLLIDGDFRESSHDRFSGGSGNDVFIVEHVPAFKDVVVCSSGFDRVLADRKDVVAPDCERVRIVHGSLDEVVQQEEQFFESIPQSFFEGLPPFPF
jgi:hypothetical protein